MAKKKKKTSSGEATSRRKRRTPEEIIAELQSRIEAVKKRQETRKLTESAAVRTALAAVKAIDKAAKAAEEEGDRHLRHALADARTPLADQLIERGIKLAKTVRPKGPRPK